jgi:hypothetical protein
MPKKREKIENQDEKINPFATLSSKVYDVSLRCWVASVPVLPMGRCMDLRDFFPPVPVSKSSEGSFLPSRCSNYSINDRIY